MLTGLVAMLGSLLLAAGAHTQDLATDREALVALYNATDGPSWIENRNWVSDADLNRWHGVSVQNGRVTNLVLHSNRLNGTIPSELGNLTKLQDLVLHHNQLTGPIPPELGNLANLQRLLIGSNQLTGLIPTELSHLTNLRELNLGFNQLTGPIPTELSHLANLQVLYLLVNQLTGPIPTELSYLANLKELGLSENQLTRSIPVELGNLANLERLNLSNNPLTGPIPPELSNLVNLERLGLSNNQLTGPIPVELGNLSNLERLSLSLNQLTGLIPPELGNLSNLKWLDLGNNQLTGPIPPELGNLSNLEWLHLGNNQLTGPIPPELSYLANLKELLLSENRLTGFIPVELGNLSNLEGLVLGNNQLAGPIPLELVDLSKLQTLSLGTNQLTGAIPPELGNLSNLRRLFVDENQLTGSIPPELGNLANLRHLSFLENRLTGPIPSELGNLANLERLYLGTNQLTGPLPPHLGSLAKLGVLSLDANQLTGSIPLSFANLAGLDWFWFHLNPGLCAGADTVIRNWLDGISVVLSGPDCSPSIRLSVNPSNLLEGSGATPVTVTATQTPVSRPTSIHLLIGGTAELAAPDYLLDGSFGPINVLLNALTIPANSTRGTTILTLTPLADGLIEGTENIILQAAVGAAEDLQNAFMGTRVEGTAILTLNEEVGCGPRDRPALEALYEVAGGTNWTNRTNWLSTKPLSEWYGVTVDNNGCITSLDLSDNRLTGVLPLQLGDLVNLEELVLSGNRLTGIIPSSFTDLAALTRFWFHLNSGLCAQADPSIRTWLNGIEDIRGPECSSIFVPVLLTSGGRNNSLFTSELTLTNRGSEEAILHYTYTAHAGGGSGTATDRLAPGRQTIRSDAIDYLTKLGIPIPGSGSRIGTLRVEVADSSAVSVVTRTTTAVPEGRAGLAYPGIAEDEGFQEAVYLCGLRENTQDRSNVALQNMGAPGEGELALRVTVFSGDLAAAGRSKVLPDLSLPPGGFYQYDRILDTAGFDNGYVKVERVSGTAPYYAYGVINDNFNSDGSFVFPLTESSLVGRSGQTVPVIIETGNFQSELTLTNFSASEKTVDFRFVADAVETVDDTAAFSLTLKAGEQRVLPDIVEELRRMEVDGIGPAGRAFVGALFATPAEGDMSGIVIGARTGAPDQRGGQYSLFYNGVPYGSASVESAWIYGLQQNAENRSNLALVNTGEIDDSPITLEITIYDGRGESQRSTKSVTLKPRRWTQKNGILGNISQGYVWVRKTSGNNPFVAYGVINDGGRPSERSGDGAYVPARE